MLVRIANDFYKVAIGRFLIVIWNRKQNPGTTCALSNDVVQNFFNSGIVHFGDGNKWVICIP